MDDGYHKLVATMQRYAARAGYLEGVLSVIAAGNFGVDPTVAARRALDSVDKYVADSEESDE